MKSSLQRPGTGAAFLRLTLFALSAALAANMMTGCGPQPGQSPFLPQSPQAQKPLQGQQQGSQPAAAAASSLVGQWRTTIQSGTITISIEANGQYMQTGTPATPGGTQTAQGGPYELIAPNTIAFAVTGYSPRTRMIYVPNPGPVPSVPNPVGPYPGPQGPQWQEEAMPQPPGSRYAYTFKGPNTMVLTNEQARETLTFTRVTGR